MAVIAIDPLDLMTDYLRGLSTGDFNTQIGNEVYSEQVRFDKAPTSPTVLLRRESQTRNPRGGAPVTECLIRFHLYAGDDVDADNRPAKADLIYKALLDELDGFGSRGTSIILDTPNNVRLLFAEDQGPGSYDEAIDTENADIVTRIICHIL